MQGKFKKRNLKMMLVFGNKIRAFKSSPQLYLLQDMMMLNVKFHGLWRQV